MADERFSGDMSRNEVEIDLNEFMELTTAEVIAQHIFLRLSENRFPDHITLESVKVCKVGMCAEVRG